MSKPPARNSSARRSRKRGLSPGSLVHVGERKIEKTRITVMDFDAGHFLEKEVTGVEECFPFCETATVTWINVDGVHDAALVERLGKAFGLHPLILEDIMTTSQRPKVEDMGESIYVVLRMLEYDNKREAVEIDQLSLIFGKNYVLSFQEKPGDMFDPVRDRLRQGKGKIRSQGPDYLAYSLLDAVVDAYFGVLERLGDRIDDLEEDLIKDPKRETLHEIHGLKREMLLVRRAVWPLREVIARLGRAETPLVRETTGIFFRDVYDHTIQAIDSIETFRDMLSGMLDTYLSSLSNRMNEVMKVLTIIATIFIPLTFLAGVYGMNFEFMPELKWRYGYFLVWGIMAAAAVTMIAYFRRKRWL